MNTNPVTQKQFNYIADLKSRNSETGFLYRTTDIYKRIEESSGKLPDAIYGDNIFIGILSSSEQVFIPTEGDLTPKDLMEMKKAFDSYIFNYEPETSRDASIVIEILNGSRYTVDAVKFIFDWLKKNYEIKPVLVEEGYCKGMTKYFVGKKLK